MYLHHWIENTAWWLDAATGQPPPAAQAFASPPLDRGLSVSETGRFAYDSCGDLDGTAFPGRNEGQNGRFYALLPAKTRVFVYLFVILVCDIRCTYGMICGQFYGLKKRKFGR
jgi:hypothetical protein